MAKYIQIEFQNISPEQSDLLIAELTNIGFEGFEEAERNLKAYIPEIDFDEGSLKIIAEKKEVSFIKSFIEETNWNAVWESNFEPVVVDDFIGIRADFHEPVAGVEQEIVITPKMSFGTGHHATTFMMVQQMREINFTDNAVLDFGTGTGILAILAEKLGAAKISAIDNDDWSIENAAENLQRNDCIKTKLQKAEDAGNDQQYDIILANINKNVILANFSLLVKQLNPGGVLLLSGLLTDDEKDILAQAGKYSLQPGKITKKNGWISLKFVHKGPISTILN